jgi:hypothetical protein
VSERLPRVAEARIAELRSSGTWGSTLSADEFAAIRSLGFEPVGQAMPKSPAGPNWSASRGTTPDARRQLESNVRRLGADGVVIATMEMEVRERDCPQTVGRRDHIVEATIIGTAIARFAPAGQHHDRPVQTIMSLDPERRQAARSRI